MKFGLALKHVAVGETVGRLESTGRLFPCMICRAVTGWRVDVDTTPGVPICSDECLDEWDATRTEISPIANESDRVSGPSPEPVVQEADMPLERDSGHDTKDQEAPRKGSHH